MNYKHRNHFSNYDRETYAPSFSRYINREQYLDCALGINPYGYSPQVKEEWRVLQDLVHQYPLYSKEPILEYWADVVNLQEENLFIDAGSYGILERINKLLISEGSLVLGYSPQFTDYITDVKCSGGLYETVLMCAENNFKFNGNDLVSTLCNYYTAVYIDNPNNPTGQVIPLEAIYNIALKAAEHNVLVIIDEAYGDYMDKCNSAISLIGKLENIFVVRSFSKGFGLAGLRVGYMFAPKGLSALYEKVTHPFTVNAPGLHLAYQALADVDFMSNAKKKIAATKVKIAELCGKLKILETDPAVPLLTIGHKNDDIDLQEEFMKHHVISTSGSHFYGLGKNYVRIRVPREEMVDMLLKAIKAISISTPD